MKTDTVLRKEGMSILLQNLGSVDAERFIALLIREPFDYTQWRQKNLANEDIRSLSKKALAYSRDLDKQEKSAREEL